jgi:D-alanyl-D-alanine carboxypeptidase/D-alanyl-D-alanine-endopeptidase (penicillin-binding protein 4)
VVAAILAVWVLWGATAWAAGKKSAPVPAMDWREELTALVGSGGLLVLDPQGAPALAIHPDQPYMPASVLKVVSTGAALDSLGPDYRFITEFRYSSGQDLYMVGRGDPYLISEELDYIAGVLKEKGLARVRNLFLDNRFFEPGLVLDGTERTLNPYDAYNGALSANFNTIYVQISPKGDVVSAEPQTPLTDMARRLAMGTKARGKVRFNLADHPDTCLLYAGELMKAFLEKHGISVTGQVAPVQGESSNQPLLYRHASRRPLSELIRELMKYSNNFMTNQIFLTAGAERFGPPATVDKARRVVDQFLARIGAGAFHMEEGSGLSRKNQVTPRQLASALRFYLPYRTLLEVESRSFIKTGTLRDVRSLVGYLGLETGTPHIFVLVLNGDGIPPKARERVLEVLENRFLGTVR